MPKHCPPSDEITLALRVSIPKVYEQTIGNALNCTYYVDGGNGITCNMYTGNFKADQAHMATLAESILESLRATSRTHDRSESAPHNPCRRHSALGWASPQEFETQYRHQAATPQNPFR